MAAKAHNEMQNDRGIETTEYTEHTEKSRIHGFGLG
jgi:hypothetical protein